MLPQTSQRVAATTLLGRLKLTTYPNFCRFPAEIRWATRLHISFETQELREICSTDKVAAERLGADDAFSLQSTLSDLDGCDNLSDLFIGNPRSDPSKGPLDFLVDVTPHLRLSFRATNQSQAGKTASQVQPDRINRIKILELVRC